MAPEKDIEQDPHILIVEPTDWISEVEARGGWVPT